MKNMAVVLPGDSNQETSELFSMKNSISFAKSGVKKVESVIDDDTIYIEIIICIIDHIAGMCMTFM